MTLKVSTGARNKLLDTGSLKTTFNLGKIRIFSGAVPATADAAETGTLLCVISNAGTATGLTLGTAASGSIPKTPAEVWNGVNVASGTATYFRYVAAGDTAALSTTEARLQGAIATAGTDLNLSSINLTTGATQSIDAASITLPTL